MRKLEVIKRYSFFCVGLFLNSLGVTLATKANLGTSPISSIPYTLSIGFKPSLGQFTLYFSIFLLVAQIILLRRNFKKEYWLQLPIAVLFSYFIDFTMNLLYFIEPQLYILKVIYLLLGCFILGVGVFMEFVANVAMLPGEAFVKAVSNTFDFDFGKIKVVFDFSMAIIASIIGILLYHNLLGVREGTILAAIIVGTIAKTLKIKFGYIEKYLVTNDKGNYDRKFIN